MHCLPLLIWQHGPCPGYLFGRSSTNRAKELHPASGTDPSCLNWEKRLGRSKVLRGAAMVRTSRFSADGQKKVKPMSSGTQGALLGEKLLPPWLSSIRKRSQSRASPSMCHTRYDLPSMRLAELLESWPPRPLSWAEKNVSRQTKYNFPDTCKPAVLTPGPNINGPPY